MCNKMPEMFINIKMSDTPSPVIPVNQCTICMQSMVVAKTLQCGHFICLNCVSTCGSNSNASKITVIKCPIDGGETPGGAAVDGKTMETKFFGYLPCGNCQKRKTLAKCWWCETCGVVSCSDCAMRNHRNHTCEPWDTMLMVGECYDYLKSINKQLDNRKNFDRLRIDVAAYCEQLYQKLTRTIDDQEKSITAQKSIEHAFHDIVDLKTHERDVSSFTNIDKKMELVGNLLRRVMREENGNGLCELDNRKVCPTVLQLPPVDEVFDFIVKLSDRNVKEKTKQLRDNFFQSAENGTNNIT